MTHATLLVELRCEELPPKSLNRLATAFADGLANDLRQDRFLADHSVVQALASPRRLVVRITHVRATAPDQQLEVQGPTLKVGLDAAGNATPALQGFAKKNGVALDALLQIDTPKGKVFAARKHMTGSALDSVLANKVSAALQKLPIPKLMRWGAGEAQFVRPVHGLMLLHGTQALSGEVLGVQAGRRTLGHRFMSQAPIDITTADTYEAQLRDIGKVIVDAQARREMIQAALHQAATQLHASLGAHDDLLDEVTALVEHPSVYVGAFDPEFLQVPQECLILTMRQNQKYFPLFDAQGILLPKFLIVSNMQVADAQHIIGGNQRVVRPRLEDARFFYTQDRKTRLEARIAQLDTVVYHNKLGTQLKRSMRVQQLAGYIARCIGADVAHTERAAWLAKADLLSGMVGEFPELQGTMGRDYALHDNEPSAVADAIEDHYKPRFAGDVLPRDSVGIALALADKLDTLVGMFAIGQLPTGDKDPFALRRHALGVIRMLIERDLPIEVDALLAQALQIIQASVQALHDQDATAQALHQPTLTRISSGVVLPELRHFLDERLAGALREQQHNAQDIDAVLALQPTRFGDIPRRLQAVRSFAALPEAPALAAANKRIGNLLKKSTVLDAQVQPALLREAAEQALYQAMQVQLPQADAQFESGDYTSALKILAALRVPVDQFFTDVMVNAEEMDVRNNRLALLQSLHACMNRVADLSKLAA